MEFRPAVQSDLPQLKEVYTGIYLEMCRVGVNLWNENYPYDALPGDIAAERLWLLCDADVIAAAFALDICPEMTDVQWQEANAPATVLMRLGVNVNYRRRGLGERCLEYAGKLSRERGAEYLRMLVVDCNTPAERFYISTGCVRVPGDHHEHVEGIPGGLTEYGYELKL